MNRLRLCLAVVLAALAVFVAVPAYGQRGEPTVIVRDTADCPKCAITALDVAAMAPSKQVDGPCIVNPLVEAVTINDVVVHGVFLRGLTEIEGRNTDALVFMRVRADPSGSRLVIGTFCLPYRRPFDIIGMGLGALIGGTKVRPRPVFQDIIRENSLSPAGSWSVFGSALASWPTIEIVAAQPPAIIEIPDSAPVRADRLTVTLSPEEVDRIVVKVGKRMMRLKDCAASNMGNVRRYTCR